MLIGLKSLIINNKHVDYSVGGEKWEKRQWSRADVIIHQAHVDTR